MRAASKDPERLRYSTTLASPLLDTIQRGTDYEIDTASCDCYGRNVTWNVNGFLRRVW